MSFIKKQGFQFFIFFGIFALIAGIAHAEVSAETQYVFNTFLFLSMRFLGHVYGGRFCHVGSR